MEQLDILKLSARRNLRLKRFIILAKNESEVDRELLKKVLLEQLEETMKVVNYWGKDEDSFCNIKQEF